MELNLHSRKSELFKFRSSEINNYRSHFTLHSSVRITSRVRVRVRVRVRMKVRVRVRVMFSVRRGVTP